MTIKNELKTRYDQKVWKILNSTHELTIWPFGTKKIERKSLLTVTSILLNEKLDPLCCHLNKKNNVSRIMMSQRIKYYLWRKTVDSLLVTNY